MRVECDICRKIFLYPEDFVMDDKKIKDLDLDICRYCYKICRCCYKKVFTNKK